MKPLQPTRQHTTITLVIVLICVLGIGLLFLGSAQSAIRQQEAETLRATIVHSAAQCCAIEGAYPLSLSYLQTNYGLTADTNRFVIQYECFAENIAPTVTVVPR
ncbi:MAG: hypothetical protein LKF61_03630 [Eggerthellaceae bacterium]|mgnify:CR=1 FL=1|jgi:hypothetical protein|nr:hypothetical protein [Eggerthellaceae bacterium]MCH4221013.1 hypothetical protein [Eggerthellaceae bacterium]